MNFFGTKIQPILYVDVNVFPEEARADIIVARAETVGSEAAEKISSSFSIKAINRVSAGIDNSGRKVNLNRSHLSCHHNVFTHNVWCLCSPLQIS